jgi:hypothetical protein
MKSLIKYKFILLGVGLAVSALPGHLLKIVLQVVLVNVGLMILALIGLVLYQLWYSGVSQADG